MIDTHCHLSPDQFEDDLDAALDRPAKAAVSHIFLPAIDLGSLPKMHNLHHPELAFHKIAAHHPTSINDDKGITDQTLYDLSRHKTYIAVPETGLDYYWSEDYKSEQQASLRMHCRVAKEVQKPIVLHNRESTDDLLDIVEEEQDGSLKGVWHSFTGSVDEGKRAIDLGLELGIGGIFTFKNSGVDEAVAELPIEHMMVETDAPYLAPDPNRGKRNEPAFVKYTAERLAEVMDISLEEVETITDKNALRFFGIS